MLQTTYHPSTITASTNADEIFPPEPLESIFGPINNTTPSTENAVNNINTTRQRKLTAAEHRVNIDNNLNEGIGPIDAFSDLMVLGPIHKK
jgi:hypothetical protein